MVPKISLYIGGFVAIALFAGVTGYVLLGGVPGTTGESAQLEQTAAPVDEPLYEVAALWQSLENETASTSEATASSGEGEGETKEEKLAEVPPPPPPPKKPVPPPPSASNPASLCSSVSSNPVCGTNGMTYKNECLAKTSGATIDHVGACAAPESVPPPPSLVPEPVPAPAEEEPETPLSGAYPDFIVRSISTFGTLFEGEPLGFSVTVKNQGTERAFERFNVGLYLDIGNNEVFELSFTPQESHALEKGEEVTLLWPKGTWTQSPGTHTVGACADSEKIIQESLEKNNCETLEFTVLGKVDNADLLVSSIRVAPNAPAVGSRPSFSADVKNTGPRIARSPKFKLFVGGSVVANNSLLTPGETNGYDMNLEPGEEDTITWTGNWIPKEAGTHTFKICADSPDEIKEVNEEDNCKEGAFVVSG